MDARADVSQLLERLYDLIDRPDLNRCRDGFRELTDEISTLCMVQAIPDVPEFTAKLYDMGLSRQEIILVEFMFKRKGRVISREALRGATTLNDAASKQFVSVIVSNVRKRLVAHDAPFRIETVVGYGYRLMDGPGKRPGTGHGRAYREYDVLGVATDTETSTKYVVYVACESDGERWLVRPLDMFEEKVSYKGRNVPRFTLLSP